MKCRDFSVLLKCIIFAIKLFFSVYPFWRQGITKFEQLVFMCFGLLYISLINYMIQTPLLFIFIYFFFCQFLLKEHENQKWVHKMYIYNKAKIECHFILCGKVKHGLRVTSSNPRVTNSSLRVTSSNSRVTSSNPRVTTSNSWVTSSNSRVTTLKARVARLKARVGRLKGRVGRLKAWVRRLKARVEAMKSRVRQ